MNTLLEFITVFGVSVLPGGIGTVFSSKALSRIKETTGTELLASNWQRAISEILVVLYVALNQHDGLASIGIFPRNETANSAALLIGTLTFVGVMLVTALGQRWFGLGRKNEIDLTRLDNAAILQPQDPLERAALLTAIPFEVIAEELVFRGYFVLLLAKRTGMVIPWAILSVVLSVLLHLYQGRTRSIILWHLLLSTLFVALTVLTGNLITSTVIHTAMNLVYTIQIWNYAKKVGAQQTWAGLTSRARFGLASLLTINILILAAISNSLLAPSA